MRSSKKRKIGNRPMKRFTADLELEVYEKLSRLAGANSLSNTMERMINRTFDRALEKQSKKQSAQVIT